MSDKKEKITNGQNIKIDDITVNCINAQSQVEFHRGYEFRDKDIHDVKLLCETFNIPVPEEYKDKI